MICFIIKHLMKTSFYYLFIYLFFENFILKVWTVLSDFTFLPPAV